MNEKQYAVLLTETQDVRIIACNPEREMFDIAREAIGCDWIELVEAEPLAKDDLLMKHSSMASPSWGMRLW